MRALRLVGAVTEADRPLRGVVTVIGHLLDPLGGDRREHRVDRLDETVEHRQPPRGEDQQAHDAIGEVAVRRLDERDVAELGRVAEVGEVDPRCARCRRRLRHGSAAGGPGRADRGRCWRGPPRPPASARSCTTAADGATSRGRRRRASGSTSARSSPLDPGRHVPCRHRRADRRTRCRTPSADRSPRSAPRRRCRCARPSHLAHHICGTSSGIS